MQVANLGFGRTLSGAPIAFMLLLLAAQGALAQVLMSPARSAPGPDVTVFELPNTTNYGVANGIRGYAVGTDSCNVGDTPLNWCNAAAGCGLGTTSRDHPVIGQNMYRLKDGRMDQIGASWLKHGFTSLNLSSTGCGSGTCQAPPLGGRQLGVGCTDPYSSGLNGTRPMGRKSEVNASTGAFPFPIGGGGSQALLWNQRLAVAEADMSAALNPGARYFVEGHYVAPDDALAGNGLNNASYREVTINPANFNLIFTGPTVRQASAIQAWATSDPSVQLVNVDLPSVPIQRFQVARKVTVVTPGQLWRYEYAVRNMNSDRSADRLAITFGAATVFTGVGFKDVDSHSNEPYDTANWTSVTTVNGVAWSALAFPSAPQNANALRWSTMYNFWFEANRPPGDIADHSLRMFTPGNPAELHFLQASPAMFRNGFELLP